MVCPNHLGATLTTWHLSLFNVVEPLDGRLEGRLEGRRDGRRDGRPDGHAYRLIVR